MSASAVVRSSEVKDRIGFDRSAQVENKETGIGKHGNVPKVTRSGSGRTRALPRQPGSRVCPLNEHGLLWLSYW